MKLDEKLDEILDLFAEGHPFRVVAKKMNVSTRTLNKFLSLPENINEYRSVMQESSDSYASMAEETLLNAKGDKFELQRARELAHHYRWMASKRNPKKYGEKLDVDHTTKGESINVINLGAGVKPTEE